MSTAPVSQLADQSSKVEVRFGTTQPQRRLTVLFRGILVIPQLIVLAFVGIGAFFVGIVGWFAAMFTGRLPESMARFLLGYVRWAARVSAYMFLLVDKYPPFSVDADPTFPVDVSVTTGRLNRAAVLFRIILVIPASIVNSVLNYGIVALGIITWIATLTVGRMPDAFFGATSAAIRYQARVTAYLYLLTSYYPSDLFGDKGLYGIAVESPVSGTVDVPLAAPIQYGGYGQYGGYAGYGQYGTYAPYGQAPGWGSAPHPPPPPGPHPTPPAPPAPGASVWGAGPPGVTAPVPPPPAAEPMPPADTPYPQPPDPGAAPHVTAPTVPPPFFPGAAPPPPPPAYPVYPGAAPPPPAYPGTFPPPYPGAMPPPYPGAMPPPYPGAMPPMPPIATSSPGFPQYRSGSFWPLVLSKGARTLVVIVIVVGSLTYIGSQVALSRLGQDLSRTLARHQVQTAYANVSDATASFKTQRQTCLTQGGMAELSCLEQADRNWASAIEAYEADLSVVVYPLSALTAAQDARYAATEAVSAVTSLANSPTLLVHATDFQSPGFRATINSVDSTYHTLNQALGG